MKIVKLQDDITVKVDNGVVSSSIPSLNKLANVLLAGTFGAFNNQEVYHDRDRAIAHFLAKELNGEVVR
ncbi:MAG: hypothetical protein WCP55_20520 [Lentisphaerota bacterium]